MYHLHDLSLNSNKPVWLEETTKWEFEIAVNWLSTSLDLEEESNEASVNLFHEYNPIQLCGALLGC